MKHIIKMTERYGKELRTRQLIEQFAATLNTEDEYLLDMTDIEVISRSAADELYNLTHDMNVEVINMCSFVQRMYDAVTLGRFKPRELRQSGTPIVQCKTIDDVVNFLNAI